MIFLNKFSLVIVVLFIAFLSACGVSPASTQSEHGEPAMDHDEAMEHDSDGGGHTDGAGHNGEDGDDHSPSRVPNNGALIRIVSPADGAEIEAGSDIVVEVETENFELGEDGRHWHVFVDGQSRGMIMGRDFDEVLRGLEPGEHEIATTMSIDTHEELEEGDSITITIVE